VRNIFIDPKDWGADANIVTKDPKYIAIGQIHLIELPLSKGYKVENEDLLIKVLYYHYVFRLGYTEPVFNILLSPSGKLYQLSPNGFDAQMPHNKTNGVISIGIITNEDTTLSTANIESLTDGVLKILSQFGLSEKDIFASRLKLIYSEKPTVSFLPSEDEKLIQLAEEVKKRVTGNIKPMLPKIELPSHVYTIEANPEEVVDVEIPFINKSETPIYGGKIPMLLIQTTDPNNRKSECFDQTSWIAPNKTGEILEGRVTKDSKGTIKFKCKGMLMPGNHTEKFEIVTVSGQSIEDASFTLNIKIKDIGQKVLQVRSTPTGYLNVRASPSLYSEVIATAGAGEKYLFYDHQSGFYKIKIDDKYGWVSERYVEILKDR